MSKSVTPKALILVGGFGTRLRPLTFSKPKPLVEFANKAILRHQIEALVEVGVKDIVLAVNYKPETMMDALKEFEELYNIRLHCSVEVEPLGTAGPLALAKELLDDGSGDPFFVFNSDVTCEYPLQSLLNYHLSHGKEGTIMVTRVDEPSKYGVVVHDESGRIQHFVEKPQTFVGNHINAGLYIFNPSILSRLSAVPTSIEKEIFPVMADEGNLYAMILKGYWMDIGQPKDYLTGTCMHLKSLRALKPHVLACAENYKTLGVEIRGNVLIHETAKIEKGAVIGPDVVVGPGCVVAQGARLIRCTLLSNTIVKAHGLVSSSLIGWNCVIGEWANVRGESVLGEDVTVEAETVLNGAIILPHKAVKDNIFCAQIIM